MITTVAGLLAGFIAKQAELLGQEAISHGPTIGEMYEGLTKELLDRAIPPAFSVKIVDGFVEGVDGRLSPQVDAMLVVGNSGRLIPKTSRHIWPINDVLATFEVKKTLYGSELRDACAKSAAIWQLQEHALRMGKTADHSLEPARNACARLTGRFISTPDLARTNDASVEFFRVMVAEQIAPVRVIFGYQGYIDEQGLRTAFLSHIDSIVGQNLGPMALPNLIVCRQNTVLKLNGYPYVVPQTSDTWLLYASERRAPLRLLIELIWTRLSRQFGVAMAMDDTLEVEELAPLLSAEFTEEGGKRGWLYHAHSMTKASLAKDNPLDWTPVEISEGENLILLIGNDEGWVDLDEPELRAFAQKRNFDLDFAMEGLVKKRLFAWLSPREARPVNERTGVTYTPDGKTWAAADGELLRLWLENWRPADHSSDPED